MAGKMANTEGTSGTPVVQVEGDIFIDPALVSHSVYVTGYKSTARSEDLIIHFQRTKNGGGDIESIVISKRGAAVITFDSPEVVKTVLQKKQEFDGVALTVKPYEESMKMDNHDYEVFELVSAELCLEMVQLLTRGQTKTLLDEIAGKTGIKWIEVSESFTMSGDFKQVERSRTYLQQAINQSGGIAEFSGLRRKMTQPQKHDDNKSQFNGDENDGGLSHASTRAFALQNGVHRQEQEPHKTQFNRAPSVTPPAIQHFEVEPKFIKVFVKAHKTDVNDIEAEYHVEVPREAKGGKISLIPKDGCSSEEYDKACDLFIDLYQQMTLAMKMERFSLKSEKNVVHARSKIREMSKTFPVCVEMSKDQKHWELYGEERHLEAALEFLRKEEIEIKRESGKENGAGEFQVSRHDEEAMDVDPPGSQSNDPLETYIGKFKVSVYKGDLTSERVDVIVNPSNNRLLHEGGMSKALLDKGGKVIEIESNKIIAKRKSLKDCEAVITDSGYLPCEKVIHAVGPDFRRVGLPQSRIILRQACLNSLIIANECKMTSIALPAMGSGTCGMPKDDCAKVMFDAVEEFIKQGKPKKKTITDIRFVNIDDLSVQAFSMEFMSRYGNSQDHSDSKKLTGGRSIKVPPNGAEGAVSSSLPSSRSDRGKNKTKQSSYNGRITTNPRGVASSHHHNAIGNTNASAGHPLSVSNQPNTSYSSAVRKTPGAGNDARSFTAQDPGGGVKPGFHLGHSTDRKFVDSAAGETGSESKCPICLDTLTNARSLKCKHVFCTDCVETALKHNNRCPICKEVQGVMKGNQPKGDMDIYKSGVSLPGNRGCGTITINYYFPSGTQGPEHPNPGQRYDGTQRTAYLPDNREGNEVLQLLKRAFDARLVFTVGTSVTSGLQNQITWNDIHHKTNMSGGPHGFGYPDPDYLRRVKEDLAAKGIR